MKLPGKVKERRRLAEKIRKAKVSKPEFVRQESWRYKRVKPAWRRPRGIDSKMRIKKKGWPPSPNTGYRTPRKLRGLHPSGMAEVLVRRVEELKGLNPEVHAVRIAGSVGLKKKLEIFREASQLGLKVLNPPRRAEGGS